MQKKLIALAVAGLVAAPAFAQSNVTIYGRVDYGFVSRNGSSGDALSGINGKSEFMSGVQGGSRIGFKGAEDLGNGLKAIFELEYGLAVDEDKGKGISSNRHSYVGLTGNFGTVVGGRLDGVRYNIFGKYDPFGLGTVGNFTQMTGQVDRADNAIAYISPSFSGFTVTAAYSSNIGTSNGAVTALGLAPTEADGNRGDARLNTLMVSYDNGPLSVTLDAERVYVNHITSASALDGADFEERVYTIGASYDFGVVKLSALYDINKVEADGTDLSDVRSWFVGAKVPVGGATVVKAMYGRTKEREDARFVGTDKPEASKWGIGVDYNLSKRTSLYADYGSIHNKDNSNLQITPSAAGYASSAYVTSDSTGYGTKGFDIGIAHKF